MARKWPEATIADYVLLLEVALRTLHLEFERVNLHHLHGALRPPGFSLHDGTSRLGYWHPMRRVVSISLDIMLDDYWEQVVEVLRHEVAHAYTREVLDVRGESAHGPAFRRACELLQVSPSPSTKRRGRGAVAGGVTGLTDELRRRGDVLLNDLGVEERQHHLSLGRSFVRVPAEQYALSSALHGICGVVCLWTTVFDTDRGRWARRLQINGPTEAAVQTASQVHAALERAVDQHWMAFKNLYDWPTRRERTAFACALFEAVFERYGRLSNHVVAGSPGREDDRDRCRWFHQRHPIHFERGEASDRGEPEAWAAGLVAGGGLDLVACSEPLLLQLRADEPASPERLHTLDRGFCAASRGYSPLCSLPLGPQQRRPPSA